ncbi:NAD-dependent epimerase/dehydratase family protein [Pedobacter sp. UC225_61]|uniref:NAD-dependent epimerase/dehydratase family protein n=1 Tax=Pedobacter sp. UC225_61 TaxID=3374623 RepID=UPI0037B3BE3D
MNKNVIILAGGGFLGKTLINSLKLNGYNQIGCIDLINPNIVGVEFYALDLLKSSTEDLITIIKNYDIVINCLGQITNPINICFRLNTEGINRITDAVVQTNKFLFHFSTVTVYGSAKSANEETDLNPETPYSCSKAFAEYLIESKLDNNKYCIVRLSNLYGDEQPKGVFSYLKRSYNSDRILEFNNNGEMVRYYLHVKDCASIAVELLSQSISGKYNLIGPDKFTLKELISAAEQVLHIKFKGFFDDVVAPDNTLYITDEKLKKQIGVKYNYSIQESFKVIFK